MYRSQKSIDTDPILDVRNLTVTYRTEQGLVYTVRNVSLQIAAGEIYGLVGESGSGKSTLARAIVRYLADNGQINSGSIKLGNTDLLALPMSKMQQVWGSRITMVHQDPAAAVNPSITIGEQIAEIARLHLHLSSTEARAKALEMLEKMRMPDPESVAKRYPHQLSGGMLQRVVIAIALTTNPQLLIMDEPTTSLDVTTEAAILDLVRELLAEYNMAVLFITHNLGVVANICNRVGVMYAGEIMEEGAVQQVFNHKLHPYTRGLLGCLPKVTNDKRNVSLSAIPGYIPRMNHLPSGCIFGPRCKLVEDGCQAERPSQVEAEAGHFTACRRWGALHSNPNLLMDAHQVRDIDEHEEGQLVFKASNIKKYFDISARGFASSLSKRSRTEIKAVDNVSVGVRGGFTLGVVGESGCGKTTFARCIAGLEEATSGEMELEGELIPYTVSKRTPTQRKGIQMVFQNPDASLNPHYTIGDSVSRPLVLMGNLSKEEIQERVSELFRAVNLPEDYTNRLPHELSGGEKQRIAIARALASEPTMILCDEPLSSLDVSVQAALINLLIKLQDSSKISYLFISHDLAAVRYISDWVAVMYLGRICEVGSSEDVFMPPYHPYTEALLSAIPIPDPDVQQERIRLEGNVPSPINLPPGCRFHTRCPRKIGEICEAQEPPWQDVSDHHQICCHITLDELRTMQSEVIVGQADTLREVR
ncbi:MAG: ABC transporter ATP-binding protein [Syntrophaceticus sp.]|nr:ABC transporter ATP-binding protein [Syntrophaceticus sp.]MDD3315223.1 ABC transporter ATP-binding protein [Syntrophaceticus sp.]